MKVVLSIIILILSFVQFNAQSVINKKLVVTAKVDRRVELLSIIARLARYEEYVRDDFKTYAEDVDKYFDKYEQHPAVEFAKEVRQSNSIGFDAIASMAVHLNPDLTPKFPFSHSSPDRRWGKQKAEEFAGLLQKFCRDADCESFFQRHTNLYQTAEQRFQQVLNKVDFDWYRTFYGETPKGTFNLYIGLLIGGMNFGPKVVYPNGKEELYAVIGTWKVDENNLPLYTEDFLPTIIHEFNHSFINHLVYASEKQFLSSGEKIYQPVSEKMQRMAYGNWETMIVESLVRAAVIRYSFDHQNSGKIHNKIINERNNGFLWIDELVALLGAYENNRKTYPTFRSFLPMIEGYYIDLAKRIDEKVENFEKMKAKVINIEEFTNEAQDVDPNLTRITFTFDKPLGGYSIDYGKGGKEHYPVKKVIGYNEDGTKFTVEVTLKPDWEYEFVLTSRGFQSRDGYPLQDTMVKFKTKK